MPYGLEGEVNVWFHVLHDLTSHVVVDLVAVDQVQAHVPAGGGAIGALVAAERTHACVGALVDCQLSPMQKSHSHTYQLSPRHKAQSHLPVES